MADIARLYTCAGKQADPADAPQGANSASPPTPPKVTTRMTSTALPRQSLKTRITLTTLAIFVVSLWSLSYYASQMLHKDMERLSGEQQFSTASFMATVILHELEERLSALEKVAGTTAPAILDNTAALQTLLEQHPVLQYLFNGGVIAYRLDGTAMADSQLSAGRIGLNFMDRDFIAGAIKGGKATIGRPVMGRQLRAPLFGMAVPIRDPQGHVIGALAGLINLGEPNFLDKIAVGRYGKTGGYLIVASQHRLIVTATDKSRIMEALPAPGINPFIDRFIQGYEGSAVFVNPLGGEVLASAKGVSVAGWYVVAALPTAEAFAPIHDMQQRMLLATIFLTLLAGALTWWLLKRQLAPMLAAASTLSTLSDTKQPPQPLPIARPDEIGQLIDGFNRLLETLAQREGAWRESEGRYRTLVEWSPEAIIVHRDGKIIYVNPAAIKMFGAKSAQNLVGQPILHLVHPDFHPIVLARVKNIADHGVITPMLEERYLKLDGTAIDLEVQGTPIAYDGAPAIHVVMRDITERRRAEEALRIAAIAFECQEGIVVTDANFKILRLNQASTQITGYSQQEAEGKTIAILRSDQHPVSFYEGIWSEAKHTGSWQSQMWLRRKNGEDFLAQSAITVVKDETGQLTHYVANLTDATHSQLQEQQRLLNEAAHRNLLVREVHHRIKNNLQGITGLLRQFAQQHPETADLIHQAIGQVQGISVIHGLQGRTVTSSVRLCELTGAIAHEIQNLWQTPVAMDIPPLWRPWVIAEKEAVPIALVLNELILNAVKHGGKAQGNVSITLRKSLQQEGVQITIANAGQLAPDGGQTGTHRNGLQLIAALMPRHGARIAREQHGDQVVTLLELGAPVISLDLKEAT